ncbi:recombination protein NinG [Undibacterium sp. SXout7W]|uniref:recombination protein NinG n=1 Tax=Undibacterium sp. SXout7W TaxID=3413049 RepID=UPI003BF12E3A
MTLKRTPFKRVTKAPKCKVCRVEFARKLPGQKVCGQHCAMALAVSTREKEARIEAKRFAAAERADHIKRRDALKSLKEWIAEAQVVFNRYIRARDNGLPCICCGQLPKSDSIMGGSWDAGHYRSRGSAGHLRFNEDNCHAQLKQCNRYGAGRAVDYRIGLIARIGLERVEALESNNAVHKWTIAELQRIKFLYQQKLKALKAKSPTVTAVELL